MTNLGVIENRTTHALENVSVRHLPTRVVASFSAILPGQQAQIGFSPRELLAEAGELSWTVNGRRFEARLALPERPASHGSGPHSLVYRIYPGGRANVLLEAGHD